MSTRNWYGRQAFGFPAAVGFSHARRFTDVILHAADLLVKWFQRSVFPPITVVRIAERPPQDCYVPACVHNTAAFVRGCATRPIPDRNPDGSHLAAVLPLRKMRLTHWLWLDNLQGPSALLRRHVGRSHTRVFHALTLCGGTDKCWGNDQIPRRRGQYRYKHGRSFHLPRNPAVHLGSLTKVGLDLPSHAKRHRGMP